MFNSSLGSNWGDDEEEIVLAQAWLPGGPAHYFAATAKNRNGGAASAS
jgi:hypothetical protein